MPNGGQKSPDKDLQRECLEEIVLNRFFGSFHEMKKQLTLVDGKLQELTEKLNEYEAQLVRYKYCHAGHRTKISTSENGTQTIT